MDFIALKVCFMLLTILGVLFIFVLFNVFQRNGNVQIGRFKYNAFTGSVRVYISCIRNPNSSWKSKFIESKYNQNSTVAALIFTYMRSGSTLTGDILQHFPDQFYVFEPLRFIDDDINRGKGIMFLNGTVRTIKKSERIKAHAEILYRWFNCDFQYLNLRDMTSIFIGTYSWKSKKYFQCIRETSSTINSVRQCLHLLQIPCAQSALRVIKTIRMRMESVELLLKWMPNLKVIYLIRDPRGKLSSQIKAYEQDWANVIDLSKDTCRTMMSDFQVTSKLKALYAERFKILLYETLAGEPVATAERLYDFLAINFTRFIKQKVQSLTMSVPGKGNKCIWCSKKGNSWHISHKWRVNTNILHLQTIDKYCEQVYQTIGYIKFTNIRELRDLSMPTIKDTPFVADAL